MCPNTSCTIINCKIKDVYTNCYVYNSEVAALEEIKEIREEIPVDDPNKCPVCGCGIDTDGWCLDNHSPYMMSFMRGGKMSAGQS